MVVRPSWTLRSNIEALRRVDLDQMISEIPLEYRDEEEFPPNRKACIDLIRRAQSRHAEEIFRKAQLKSGRDHCLKPTGTVDKIFDDFPKPDWMY